LITDYGTAVSGITATEKEIAANFSGISYNNLQSKMEKIAFELNRLIADITLVNAGTAVTTALGRYPSGWNRFTNTSGGI
jgi:hypothetical protein